MDYVKIIFLGFVDPSTRKFLSSYLYREFKKAENEHYEADEFFSGCLKMVNELENKIKRLYYEEKNDLQTTLGNAMKGVIVHDEDIIDTSNLTKEEALKRKILYCKPKLEFLKLKDFSLNMISLSKGIYGGQLWYSEVLEIKEAINAAYQKAKNSENLKISLNKSKPDEVHLFAGSPYTDETKKSPLIVFFNKVRHGNITELESQLFVEQITDNYNQEKLAKFLYDFEFYFWLEIEKRKGEISNNEIFDAIEDFEKRGKPIPYIKFPPSLNKKFNEQLKKESKTIDIEKLIFPYDFYLCYQFNGFLKHKLEEKSNKSKIDDSKIKIAKPVFSTKVLKQIFDVLHEHFSEVQRPELKRILSTGGNAKQKLYFMDNGNRLADTFKKLHEANFITSCDKSELQIWIANNFYYRYRRKKEDFKLRYLSDIISTTKDKCQKPLINVIFNKIEKESQIIIV